MHKGKEAIRDYLRRNGYPSWLYKSVIKSTRMHGKYDGYTVVIKTMRDAIEFVICRRGDETNNT